MKAEILLIAWRRPHTVRQVLAAIRPYAPPRLFVACDGPNPERPGEDEKVAATRAAIDEEIDWPCQVERLYSDVNQGCSVGPQRAITWFFENVEEGIILEDDCVPHPDFFSYCETLLDRYRHDERVWCISGNNFQEGQWRGDGGYYFSRYPHCWGWASWRRCWKYYDSRIKFWPKLRDSGLLRTIFPDPLELSYWHDLWQDTYYNRDNVTWWDYQWSLLCMSNSGLTALPNRNLVSNIGFGQDATHTTCDAEPMSIADGLSSFPPPTFMLRMSSADQFYFRTKILPSMFSPSSIDKLVAKIQRASLKARDYSKAMLSFHVFSN